MRTIKIILFITGLLIFQTRIIKCQIIEIHYDDWPHKCSFKTDSGKFIINNREAFNQIANCILINYDFNRYTIIGVKGAVGGCKLPTVDFLITKDDFNKKYVIQATILSYGNCRRNNGYKRIIYTEKFENDYEIEFIKKEMAYSDN